jgi:AcrR family transcriptional regulator
MLRVMPTDPRIHRTHVDNRCRNRPPLSEKQRERQEFIIEATQTLMACFSADHFTIGSLALALRMTPAAIRRHFIDVESILAEILMRHLVALARAIGQVPQDHPDRRAAQRAAYFEATRDGWGAFTEPHQLLLRARHTLPDDLARPIEQMRHLLGEALAGDRGETAFTVLDAAHLTLPRIESMLAASDPRPAAPAQPEAPPTQKPHYVDWKLARRLKSAAKQAARAARAAEPVKDPPGRNEGAAR